MIQIDGIDFFEMRDKKPPIGHLSNCLPGVIELPILELSNPVQICEFE